jgi:hypothetical protein
MFFVQNTEGEEVMGKSFSAVEQILMKYVIVGTYSVWPYHFSSLFYMFVITDEGTYILSHNFVSHSVLSHHLKA